MEIVPSQDVIGAEIRDIDLARLSQDEFARVEAAFDTHGVVNFPGQQLDEEQLVAFARRFGEIQVNFLTQYAHPRHPEILYVSNIKENGRDIGHSDAGRVWHTDMSFMPRPPRATLLYALEVPVENDVA